MLVADRSGRSFLLFLKEWADPSFRHMWIHTIDVQRGELLPNPVELLYRTGGDAVVTWDGDAILAAGQARVGVQQVGLWDLETGHPLASALHEPAYEVAWLGVDPDARLAALSENGQIEIIDLRTGDLITTLTYANELDQYQALKVAFSPDGRWLAAASGSGRVVVWETRTWELQTAWDAVPGFGVDSMMFTPDSDFLVTGGAGQAAIWNVEQGAGGGVRLEVDPSRPDATVLVGLKDNGRTLVTYTDGTGVRHWDVSPDGLLEHACTVVGRNLSQEEWSDVLPDRPYQRTCPEYPSG
jgi:WD40 repeat protein